MNEPTFGGAAVTLHRLQPGIETVLAGKRVDDSGERLFRDYRRRGFDLFIRWRGRAPFAEDLCCYALRDFRQRATIADRKRENRLSLDIDDTGDNDEPACVDAFGRGCGVEQAGRRYARDAVTTNSNVAIKPCAAGSVYDFAAAYDDVICASRLVCRRRRAAGDEGGEEGGGAGGVSGVLADHGVSVQFVRQNCIQRCA